MTAAEAFIGRLDHVTQVGTDRWRAVCPGHPSRRRTQSLSIRELADGTLLIRCHAGCEVSAIVAAVGLTIRDLFPIAHRAPNEGRKARMGQHGHSIRECVQVLRHECVVVALIAGDVAAGRPITPEDAVRCAEAEARIRDALRYCQ